MLQMLLQHYLGRAFFASTAQRVSNPKGQAAQLGTIEFRKTLLLLLSTDMIIHEYT